MDKEIFINTFRESKKKYKNSLRSNRNIVFSVNSVSRLYSELEMIVATIKSNPENSFDCTKGCTYCCSLRVEVLPPEVFYIAKQLTDYHKDQLDTIISRLKEQAQYAENKNKETYDYRCSFLENNSCSIYKHRPFMCRKLLSYDVEKCKEEKREPLESTELFSKALGLGLGYAEAHKNAKRSAGPVEFSQALLQALTDRSLVKRWYSGENVFKPLP